MVAKQVFHTYPNPQIKSDPEGSNIKVWIGISSLFSHGVTCINVILWFHKSRSSFYPLGSFGNLKHGSSLPGYKFKSAYPANGVETEKKGQNGQATIFDRPSHLSQHLEGKNVSELPSQSALKPLQLLIVSSSSRLAHRVMWNVRLRIFTSIWVTK